jgi:DNA-binding response OmpR family regulator
VRVLVIDDSAVIRSRLVRMLQDIDGVEVDEAEDADAGIEAARRVHPDAVILDIRLREGSGLHVLQALKTDPAPPLVIMLTNHPSEHHRRWCRDHGADFFFDKSREFEKVLDVLAQRQG